MPLIETIFSEPVWQALGYTLLHFLWQGTLVAFALAGVLALLRGRSAQASHAAACGALLVLLALPVVTLAVFYTPGGNASAPETTVLADPPTEGASAAVPASGKAMVSESAASWLARLEGWITLGLPWLVSFWMAGVLLLSLRYLAGWTYTLRLRRRGLREVGQRWHDLLDRVAQQMGVTRRVRLFSSTRAVVPTVIGWFRPVVLMPVAVLTGLSTRQVEMILVHELAHVRRHDYLVNLLQAIAETLLFYHPAVWWVSRRIRIEREHCCDDVVVAVCGDAVGYAEALARLEHARQGGLRLAPAATDGSLLDRIRRLLGKPSNDAARTARWLVGLLLVLTGLVGGYLPGLAQDLWDQAHEQEAEVVASDLSDVEHSLEALETSLEALEALRDVSERMESLGSLHDLPDDATRSALRRIAREHAAPSLRNEAAQALGERRGAARDIPLFEEIAFDDGSSSVQMEALDALRDLPDGVGIPSLITIAQTHPRAAMRSEAVQVLGDQGGTAEAPLLEEIAFEDRSPSVQMEALDALRDLPDGVGIPSLITIAQTHPRAAMRSEAVQWLGRKEDHSVVDVLLQIASADESLGVRSEVLDALTNLGVDTVERSD